MTALFFSSFILGLAYCAPPGIVTAETVRRGLGRGFTPALLVQLGSLAGDLTWALLAVSGAAFLVQVRPVRLLLSLMGIALLLRLAWIVIQDACRGTVFLSIPSGKSFTGQGDLAVGALLSLTSPYALPFWIGASGSIFAAIPGGPHWIHIATFLAAFLAATVGWCFLVAGLVAWGRHLLSAALFRWVNLACGTALCLFAIRLGWQLVHGIQ